MISSDEIDLSCFDRMIPNQDSLPKKGFGNLIALPLKWSDVKEQKSIFTDDNLQPLPSEKLFNCLANTKRYAESEVNKFIDIISNDMKLINGKNNVLSLHDFKAFPRKIYGFITGEIFIERQNLTRKEQLSLLGLATFSNPEFIKKQRMRMPVWDTPSVLTAARIEGSYICLPRGVLPMLKENCNCQLIEKFTSPLPLTVSFKGSLHSEQKTAIARMKEHQLGMVCAHTGFGKTVVGCALIAEREAKTLVIVPTTNIAQQWQQAGLSFLDIQDKPYTEMTKKGRKVRKKKVEIISGSRNHPSRLVDIINIRKLIQMSAKERWTLYQDYEQIIVDECHHISATTFEKVLVEANVSYIVGLTATPERKDGLEKFMYYRCGNIYYQGEENEADYLIPRYIYPRYNGALEIQNDLENNSYTKKIKKLVESNDRNKQIVSDVKQALKEERHILLLSERIEHLKILKKQLDGLSAPVYFITGQSKTKLSIKDESKAYVILSTSKYVGEGFDLASLDTLFLVLPFSWRGNTKQYLGRLERNLANKDELRVYDYVDISDDVFAKMYQKRMKVYVQQGYQFVRSAKWNTYSSAYYTDKNYLLVWEHDLAKAATIYLCLRHLTLRQVKKMNELANLGKQIHLIINADKRNKEYSNLLNSKIKLQINKEKIGNNISVFDDQIIWYGDINFGSKVYQGMSAIRLVNQALVKATKEKYSPNTP